jgi:TonB family protein
LFFVVYYLLLRTGKVFQFKRFFLLSTLIFPAIIPLLSIPAESIDKTLQTVILPVVELSPSIGEIGIHYSGNWLIFIYFLVSFVIAGRILFGIRKIVRLIKLHRCGNGKLVSVPEITGPFSFFGYIFLPENGISEDVLVHEKTHISQWHSLDVVLSELFICVFWLNPFVWLTRREIVLNHEYIADMQVIRQGASPNQLIHLLMAGAFAGINLPIAHSFGGSLIFNRIKMINMKKNARMEKIGIFISVLMATGILAGFSLIGTVESFATATTRVTKALDPASQFLTNPVDFNGIKPDALKSEKNKAWEGFDDPPKSGKEKAAVKTQKKDDQVFDNPEIPAEFPGGQNEMMNYMIKNIKYPEKARNAGIQGKVYVQFEVTSKGKVTRVKVLRGVNDEIDAEAVRVITAMPDWKPAENKGKKVNMMFTLPVSFKLSEDKK